MKANRRIGSSAWRSRQLLISLLLSLPGLYLFLLEKHAPNLSGAWPWEEDWGAPDDHGPSVAPPAVEALDCVALPHGSFYFAGEAAAGEGASPVRRMPEQRRLLDDNGIEVRSRGRGAPRTASAFPTGRGRWRVVACSTGP